jgi:hypothetical protein
MDRAREACPCTERAEIPEAREGLALENDDEAAEPVEPGAEEENGQ